MRAAEYSLGWSVAEPQVRSGFIAQARGAGDSHWPNLNDDEMAHDKKLPPAPRAWCVLTPYTWGFAFGYTPGYILPPASAG